MPFCATSSPPRLFRRAPVNHHNHLTLRSKMPRKSGRVMKGKIKGSQGLSGGLRRGSRKPPLTHFLCFPLIMDMSRPQFEHSLSNFRDEIAKSSHLPLNSIRPKGTLHFTLGVMSLEDERGVADAVAFMKGLDLKGVFEEACKDSGTEVGGQATFHNSLLITLTSLHSMHPVEQTSVLYTTINTENKILYSLASKLNVLFQANGFMVPDDRPLKLHATVLNTVYARFGARTSQSAATNPAAVPVPLPACHDAEIKYNARSTTCEPGPAKPLTKLTTIDSTTPVQVERHGQNSKQPLRFNATSLLESCKDYVWASDIHLEKLAICRMGARKIINALGEVTDEEYEEIASIPMLV